MISTYNKENKLQFAKTLRKTMTPAEKILWKKLRSNQLGFKCKKQVPIGPWIVDFAFLSLKIVIEVDGSIHSTFDQQQRDKAKNQYLKKQGFFVIRVLNSMVSNELDIILQTIKDVCEYEALSKTFLSQKPSPNLSQIGRGDLRLLSNEL
jgi:very-short-patch-repair endonuclease